MNPTIVIIYKEAKKVRHVGKSFSSETQKYEIIINALKYIKKN